MMTQACSEGRHAGTRTPDQPVVPTLDQDNRGRLVNDWSQPPCTGRTRAPFLAGTHPCDCPCHQADTKTT